MRVFTLMGNERAIDAVLAPQNFALCDFSENVVSMHLSDADYKTLKSLRDHYDYVVIWKPEDQVVLFPCDDVYSHRESMLRVAHDRAKDRGILFPSIIRQ